MEYRYRAPEPDHSIWWQIALGVFLALLAHSIVTGLYARYQFNKTMQQTGAESRKADRQLKRELQASPASTYTQPRYVEPAAPLRDGERCMQGRRFKRVENGWVQLPQEPC